MAHNRKYVFGIVDMVKIRLRNTKILASTQDEIESIIIDSNFLESAPFKWIGLMYRQGFATNLKPKYQRICKSDGELPIAIELDANILRWADENNIKLFKDIYIIGALDALIDVGRKYSLPINIILEQRAKFKDIPKTIEDCEAWDKIKNHS